MSMINSTLPIQMKVLEKTSFNRYVLLLNSKKVHTKSLVELELNAEYLAELYNDKGGVLAFKNISKKPNILRYDEGLALILKILEEDFDFRVFVIENLLDCKDLHSFMVYKEMLFALAQNIYHIPFVYEDKSCLFQLRKNANKLELYLYFSVFGSLKIVYEKQGLFIYTPFSKVASFLRKHLECEIYEDKNVKALFEFKKLLDFKG